MTQVASEVKAKYVVDERKLDKYLPELLNGKAYKLEVWLPNLLSVGGIVERESFDYWLGQFRRYDPVVYNMRLNVVIQRLEEMRVLKGQVVEAIADLKVSCLEFREKRRRIDR